ncbi:MAG: galactokinase [Clostridia bacterium]|nr:galactokinase [Clostridia bacterium]
MNDSIRKEINAVNKYESEVCSVFEARFGHAPARTFFAPGRVNLIGEHIDYNGGRVMPCSLSLGTYAAASPRADGRIRLVSADMRGGVIEADIGAVSALECRPECFSGFGWAAYPLGVAAKLASRSHSIGGFEMAVCGSLPRGSGLSSSASLEVLTCAVLKELFGLTLDGVSASLLSLEAERDCAGVNCGIMDQFVCAMGRRGAAVLLDTHTLEYGYFPFDPGENVLLIMNTKKPRRLADSKYNERRAECEEALRLIGGLFEPQKTALCEITPEEFASVSAVLPEPLLRRARHAVTENRRTLEAAEALEAGDIARLGRLINASHDSLRDDYEVTGRALDTIVEAARSHPAVLGARMTGAGFGGCAIAIAERSAAEDVIAHVSALYRSRIGYDCEIYTAETGDAPFGKDDNDENC